MRDYLLLYVNGVRREIRGARAFRSLSDYLRYELRHTGTKVVCAEGDCGSCSVLLGRLEEGQLVYHGVTSCIQFLYQLDGAHVITVEGLRSLEAMHPVQTAMVACHGAQCGFCTPGFVVAMAGMYESHEKIGEPIIRRELVGNLCRCTGYEAIINAGLAVDPAKVKRANELYPPMSIIADIERTCCEPVELRGDDGRIAFIPTTLAEAAAFKAQRPDCLPYAGGTDLGVQINKGRRDPMEVLVLGHLRELRTTRVTADAVTIGAAVTWTALERQTADTIPEFSRMLGRFASPPLKNAGTIGGNIANGSPIADSLPALYVLEAQVELTSVRGTRTVAMTGFFTSYKRSVMAADELISRVIIPRPAEGQTLKLYKISKRHDLDISTFTAAFLLERDGDHIASIRIAYGGVAGTVLRLPEVEAWLAGQPISEDTFIEAGERAATAITPLSDVRGSAAYRSRLAANIFVKLYHDLTEQSAAVEVR
ncbi:MAG TPA: FAD binding domain-containing protein [Tepidisphaeraceae bacterium]|jgi:xanthine dehydrogenase small subunit|nr:FAD binding domain-containing protein [Tepidisphaeraceae bacterium]